MSNIKAMTTDNRRAKLSRYLVHTKGAPPPGWIEKIAPAWGVSPSTITDDIAVIKQGRRWKACMIQADKKAARKQAPGKTQTTPKVRAAVRARDGGICQYCLRLPQANDIEVDHVIPRSSGGIGKMWNLVTSCRPCNRKKRSDVWIPHNLSHLAALDLDNTAIIIKMAGDAKRRAPWAEDRY